ncbi:MAG: IS4 family transposase [Crocosphaera sp.]
MAISPHPTQVLIQQFNIGIGLPFQDLLKSKKIEEILKEIGVKYKSRIYNPIVIVWSFLSQVLDPDHSCQNAVSRIISYLASEGLETPSENTSAYCQARKKIPEKLFKKLLEISAKDNEGKVDKKHLWHGRCVKSIDGSTVSMPDTLKNQQAYPQHSSQKKGCGFPLAKIGVLFSYATGSVVGIVIDFFKTHDIKLARKLTDYLDNGDILLGDRAFCSYIDICLWQKKGIDAVMRLHQGRLQKGKKKPKYTVDPPFKKKKKTRKCPHDRLILWEKPKRKPQDISREDFDSLPKDLVLREIHCYICIPGFRTKEIIVVTTLIDAIEYPSSDILDLYDSRWQAEVNLRNIKTTLGMDILSCQTPEMVRKEIYVYLLAYNLLRSIMYDAGDTFDRKPIRLSLQATRQHLNNFNTKWVNKSRKKVNKIYQTMLEKVADSYEKRRVGRVEPRVRKRRPKAYPLMQEPRAVLRGKMKSA